MSESTAPSVRPEHVRRRLRLLRWSAPVVLAFLLVGSLLLGTAFGNHLGQRDYEAMRYEQAAEQFEAQQRWTGFAEQWKAWFNSGTAEYRAEQHFRAVEDFRTALELVPEAGPLPGAPEGSKAPESPECRVRTNLSLALEAMGDISADGQDPQMAAVYYAEAREVIDPCTTSQENEDSSDRQREKEEQAQQDQQDPDQGPDAPPTEEPSAEPDDEPSDDPTQDPDADPSDGPTTEPTPEPTQDPQREDLEERNRQGEQDRQERQQRGGGGFGGGQNW